MCRYSSRTNVTRYTDATRTHRLDPDSFAGGYFRNAVYRHWDPYEDISQSLLEQDRERLIARDQTEAEFDGLRRTLALFGAGEEAVTQDLAPMAYVLDDVDEQMFLTTQLYEEAKHTAFFDRYWREVVDPVAEACGFEVTAPTDERYFDEEYVELFDRTEAAMERLLTDERPEALARAFCHYHLVVESVLAQTGYYGIQSAWSPSGPDVAVEGEPVHLEGLIEGITRVRSDEGRHVGFGMRAVQRLIAEEGVDPDVVQETLQDLLPLVTGTVQNPDSDVDSADLVAYASEKLARRVEIITDSEAELPPVEELVHVEGGRDVSADD
ncbi:ribonucleoside-diphosphate reductase [Halomarina oriensis]|uniref:Ribonucleoside-diphosphate reductase n=1 Tax=Halomarina oriensis TaxID=671145 RepID=A0A6B0GNI7_9EURY|nr:ribonucleoside-diphosphate reductase [Halomarina oriensis]